MHYVKWLMLAWIAALGAGTWSMLQYEMTPGEAAGVEKSWPIDSAVQLDRSLPTLVTFIHPRCPCSRATLEELALIMTHSEGKVALTVVFLKPTQFSAGWEQTDLWNTATSIPGAMVVSDEAGAETARFRASISGETL